jgi:hypothetical protein
MRPPEPSYIFLRSEPTSLSLVQTQPEEDFYDAKNCDIA